MARILEGDPRRILFGESRVVKSADGNECFDAGSDLPSDGGHEIGAADAAQRGQQDPEEHVRAQSRPRPASHDGNIISVSFDPHRSHPRPCHQNDG